MKLYSLGEGMKRARNNAGYTQKSLAERLAVSLKTVMNWEQGIATPSIDTLMMLCKLYNCDLDYLAGRIDCKTHSVQDISEYTGLTEKAVEMLHEWNNTLGGKFLLFTLSSLIEQKNHFRAVLSCAWNYFNPPKKEKSNSENVIVIDTSGIIPSAEETSLFMASNNLVDCIKAAKEQYQK